MRIRKNRVVTLDYVLTDEADAVIDRSTDATFGYLHGANNIIRGLERALEGKQPGDQVKVSLAPQDAYGEYRASEVRTLPRSTFPPGADIKVGMQFEALGGGKRGVVRVSAIEGNQVTVDANHPLAGKKLNFDVRIVAVRSATKEERAHSHVHGPGGHAH